MKLRVVLGLVVLSGALFPAIGRADDTKASGPPPGEKSESSAPEADDVRVRIGFNFNGGAIVAPATVGGGGFAFRLGVQANHLFGVYYQAMPMVFAGFSVGSASAEAGAIGVFQNSLLASLTPIDLVEIGAGPSLDYAGIAAASTESGSGTGGGLFFGLAGRAALHLGGRNKDSGRRTSFTIGFDPHLIFGAGDPVISLTGGLGADWY